MSAEDMSCVAAAVPNVPPQVGQHYYSVNALAAGAPAVNQIKEEPEDPYHAYNRSLQKHPDCYGKSVPVSMPPQLPPHENYQYNPQHHQYPMAPIKQELNDVYDFVDESQHQLQVAKKRGRKKKSELMPNGVLPHNAYGEVVKPRKKFNRFNGMPEEEVLLRTLPDHLAPNLDIVIIGINPGLFAAYKGHHYAGPGNHFWKCLYLSGLIPEPMSAVDDHKLLKFGIGFTNIVARTSRGSADLTRGEIKEGAEILMQKLRKYQPNVAVFNGKGIYEIFCGKKDFCFGWQPEPLEGSSTTVFVMPSSSARCAQLPRAADKVPFYKALKKVRDHLRGDCPDLDPNEVVFPDVKLGFDDIKKETKDILSGNVPEDGSSYQIKREASDFDFLDKPKRKRGRPKKKRDVDGLGPSPGALMPVGGNPMYGTMGQQSPVMQPGRQWNNYDPMSNPQASTSTTGMSQSSYFMPKMEQDQFYNQANQMGASSTSADNQCYMQNNVYNGPPATSSTPTAGSSSDAGSYYMNNMYQTMPDGSYYGDGSQNQMGGGYPMNYGNNPSCVERPPQQYPQIKTEPNQANAVNPDYGADMSDAQNMNFNQPVAKPSENSFNPGQSGSFVSGAQGSPHEYGAATNISNSYMTNQEGHKMFDPSQSLPYTHSSCSKPHNPEMNANEQYMSVNAAAAATEPQVFNEQKSPLENMPAQNVDMYDQSKKFNIPQSFPSDDRYSCFNNVDNYDAANNQQVVHNFDLNHKPADNEPAQLDQQPAKVADDSENIPSTESVPNPLDHEKELETAAEHDTSVAAASSEASPQVDADRTEEADGNVGNSSPAESVDTAKSLEPKEVLPSPTGEPPKNDNESANVAKEGKSPGGATTQDVIDSPATSVLSVGTNSNLSSSIRQPLDGVLSPTSQQSVGTNPGSVYSESSPRPSNALSLFKSSQSPKLDQSMTGSDRPISPDKSSCGTPLNDAVSTQTSFPTDQSAENNQIAVANQFDIPSSAASTELASNNYPPFSSPYSAASSRLPALSSSYLSSTSLSALSSYVSAWSSNSGFNAPQSSLPQSSSAFGSVSMSGGLGSSIHGSSRNEMPLPAMNNSLASQPPVQTMAASSSMHHALGASMSTNVTAQSLGNSAATAGFQSLHASAAFAANFGMSASAAASMQTFGMMPGQQGFSASMSASQSWSSPGTFASSLPGAQSHAMAPWNVYNSYSHGYNQSYHSSYGAPAEQGEVNYSQHFHVKQEPRGYYGSGEY